MTESFYHRTVKQHIKRYGDGYNNKYIESCLGSENPLHILHPQAKRKKILPVQYEPDVYFLDKHKRLIVFEVLESEAKHPSEVIADMIQSILQLSIKFLIFIIPIDDEKAVNRFFEMWIIITDTLVRFGMDRRRLPKLAVYYILPHEAKSRTKIKNILKKLSRQDKW